MSRGGAAAVNPRRAVNNARAAPLTFQAAARHQFLIAPPAANRGGGVAALGRLIGAPGGPFVTGAANAGVPRPNAAARRRSRAPSTRLSIARFSRPAGAGNAGAERGVIPGPEHCNVWITWKANAVSIGPRRVFSASRVLGRLFRNDYGRFVGSRAVKGVVTAGPRPAALELVRRKITTAARML